MRSSFGGRTIPCSLNTLTVLALVVMSFALIVAVPVLYASSEDSGRSNRLILLVVCGLLVLLNQSASQV